MGCIDRVYCKDVLKGWVIVLPNDDDDDDDDDDKVDEDDSNVCPPPVNDTDNNPKDVALVVTPATAVPAAMVLIPGIEDKDMVVLVIAFPLNSSYTLDIS